MNPREEWNFQLSQRPLPEPGLFTLAPLPIPCVVAPSFSAAACCAAGTLDVGIMLLRPVRQHRFSLFSLVHKYRPISVVRRIVSLLSLWRLKKYQGGTDQGKRGSGEMNGRNDRIVTRWNHRQPMANRISALAQRLWQSNNRQEGAKHEAHTSPEEKVARKSLRILLLGVSSG